MAGVSNFWRLSTVVIVKVFPRLDPSSTSSNVQNAEDRVDTMR